MYRVMIVEDEKRIREGLKLLIDWNSLGFEITGEFDNGAAALNELKSECFELLLCDIRLPILSGLELLKEIDKLNIKCKTIIISGYSDFHYAQTAIEYGVKKYMLKPVNEKDMEETIKIIKTELDREKDEDVQDLSSATSLNMQIKSFIEKNYTKNVSVKEISDEVGYNTCYIGRCFAQKTGMSIKEYLYMYRVKKACRLLLEGKLKVQDIAYEVGFKDIGKFYEAFHKYQGTSPKGFLAGLKGS